jgi:tripeptidyl-peptidase II
MWHIFLKLGFFSFYLNTKKNTHNIYQVLNVSIWHAFVSKQYGRMAKFLQKLYDEKQQREVLEEIQNIVKQKEWDHICKVLNKMIVTANPQNYRPF